MTLFVRGYKELDNLKVLNKPTNHYFAWIEWKSLTKNVRNRYLSINFENLFFIKNK